MADPAARVYRRRLPPSLPVMILVCASITALGYGAPGRRSMLILLTSWTSFGVMAICLAMLIVSMLKSPVLLALDARGLTVPALSSRPIAWSDVAGWREGRTGRVRYLALWLKTPHAGRRRIALALARHRGQAHVMGVGDGGVQLRRVIDSIRAAS